MGWRGDSAFEEKCTRILQGRTVGSGDFIGREMQKALSASMGIIQGRRDGACCQFIFTGPE